MGQCYVVYNVKFRPSAKVLDCLLSFEIDAYLVVFRVKMRSSSEQVVAVLSLCLIQFELDYYLMCVRCAHNTLWYSPSRADPSLVQYQDSWLADSLCKRNGDYCCSFCLQIHTLPYHGWVYGCPLDFAGSYHTTKAIGSTCLFYINLQLPAQDMKERLLCLSVLFQKISGLYAC